MKKIASAIYNMRFLHKVSENGRFCPRFDVVPTILVGIKLAHSGQ